MAVVFSANPQQIAVTVARWLEHGNLSEILVQRKAKAMGQTVVSLPVGDGFNASKAATEIHESCKADAEINGGKHSYDIIGLSDESTAMGRMLLTVDTGKDYTDDLRGTSGEVQYAFRMIEGIVRQQTEAFKNIVTMHQTMSNQLMNQNQMLHDKVRAQLEATEKALSEQNAREIAAAESRAQIENQSKSWDALMKFAPPILAKKFGVDPSVILSMMGSATGTSDGGPAQEKLAKVLRVFASLSEDQQRKLGEALSEEQLAQIMSIFSD